MSANSSCRVTWENSTCPTCLPASFRALNFVLFYFPLYENIIARFVNSEQKSNTIKVNPKKNAVYIQRMATDYWSMSFSLCRKEHIY